ncbi:VWA domain-containing protein [Sulfolobus sp. E5-1-F]|uniref:vWA domain-containing protein n=1 Tax=Saccharolobus sp. E5-1-F TaxID=2663019 RepID=UPI0012963F5B|nr:VWA domain-containing protein [Sulfolobus sp. E5-1-F]QGA54246.1 VWA domain-containing protein [Sulfolobus sp. E5-1-F]
MTLSLRVDTSHKYSFSGDVRYIFKVLLVPEKLGSATGFHYIIALDTSGSMSGYKIELAKQGAIELFKKIPKGNKVSFITFSSNVNIIKEFVDPLDLTNEILQITAGGQTALYTAILTVNSLAKKYQMPTYLLLLTDGNPTDETNIGNYLKLPYYEKIQVYSFGIGDDYNEQLLQNISDKTGGVMYHISDATEIPQKLPQKAVTQIAAKNVTVDITAEGSVKLLNYATLPVKVNGIENVIKIFGETILPANYEGSFLTVKVNYEDPVTNKSESLLQVVQVKKAQDQNMFVSGINNDLINEYRYYELLEKYAKQVQAEQLIEATKTLNQLNEIAQQTRRIDFMETTRRLSEGLETTKRIGTIEQTRRLSKEVTSEVTRKLRE